MGTSPHIDALKFPEQGSLFMRKVNVCFRYDTQRQIGGVIVRDDKTAPFIGIIRLDDGRHVLMTECQFREQ